MQFFIGPLPATTKKSSKNKQFAKKEDCKNNIVVTSQYINDVIIAAPIISLHFRHLGARLSFLTSVWVGVGTELDGLVRKYRDNLTNHVCGISLHITSNHRSSFADVSSFRTISKSILVFVCFVFYVWLVVSLPIFPSPN